MFQVGLWDQVLGMEQMGPFCVSALSSGGRLWKSTFLFRRSSFFSESFSCWMFWLRFSAWASESPEHCPVLFVLKQPGGRRCSSDDNGIGSNRFRGFPGVMKDRSSSSGSCGLDS